MAFTSTLSNPFPTGLTPITGNSLGTSTALGQNIQFMQPNPHTPYNQRFSFGFQRQLGAWVVSADYVGNHGVHLPVGQISTGTNTGGREYNAVPAQYLSRVTQGQDVANNSLLTTLSITNPFSGLIPAGATNNLASSKLAAFQLLRPYPEYASINAYTTDGMSMYHSFQAQLQRRFTKGFSFTTAYTWSRSLDATTLLNPTDARPWYGTSANDRPQRLAMSGIYQLPFGPGRKYLTHGIIGQVVGGWQMQGVYQIQSGAPLTFTTNPVYLGSGTIGDAHFTRSQYKASLPGTPGGTGSWFNTSNFVSVNGTTATNKLTTCTGANVTVCPTQLPGIYQIRTVGLRYNTLRGDNLNQADIGVQREFKVWEIGSLQFRGEAINVLNHPVYALPLVDPTKSTFGQITAQANQPRVYQFAGFFRF